LVANKKRILYEKITTRKLDTGWQKREEKILPRGLNYRHKKQILELKISDFSILIQIRKK